jgi:hypothetical protein
MKIAIGSEGMGRWGDRLIIDLLKKLFPNDIIETNNVEYCILIIKSHFKNLEPLWNKDPKRYIYWSGESYAVEDKSTFEHKSLHFNSLLSGAQNHVYFPYILYSPHLLKERKYVNLKRPFLLAYCNSKKVAEREKVFNLFVEKAGEDRCHSLSDCCGKYPSTKKQKAEGFWWSDSLIDTYKNYKFVIAMENCKQEGYITEKIVNAFYSGAIPIYWGSSTITEFFNERAFLNVSNFPSLEKCVEYAVNMNEAERAKMLAEPIYKQSDLLNIFNTNYQPNPVLNNYLDKLRKFIN